MGTCPSCGYVDDSGDGDGACPTPGCGAWLRPELRPSATPRIPKRALTPILGVGVVALAVVTILIAANNTARPRLHAGIEPPAIAASPAVTPAPSQVEPGETSAAPGTSAPAPARSVRPRPSASPTETGQPVALVWQSSDDVMIPDGASEANSVITVSGQPGNAPPGARVWVDIKHKTPGDLAVDLIGPSGRAFALPVSGMGGSIDAVQAVDASAEPCSGKWRLRVRDLKGDGSVGYIDNWSLDFS